MPLHSMDFRVMDTISFWIERKWWLKNEWIKKAIQWGAVQPVFWIRYDLYQKSFHKSISWEDVWWHRVVCGSNIELFGIDWYFGTSSFYQWTAGKPPKNLNSGNSLFFRMLYMLYQGWYSLLSLQITPPYWVVFLYPFCPKRRRNRLTRTKNKVNRNRSIKNPYIRKRVPCRGATGLKLFNLLLAMYIGKPNCS